MVETHADPGSSAVPDADETRVLSAADAYEVRSRATKAKVTAAFTEASHVNRFFDLVDRLIPILQGFIRG